MKTQRIRVMLADDDAGLLEALADSVRTAPDLELAGQASDATSAIQRALETQPDVVLMDARMPGGGGVTAVRELSRRMPDVKIVGLSAHEDKASALEMIEAGAVGYIVKGAPEAEILDAVRRAYRRPDEHVLRPRGDRATRPDARGPRQAGGGAGAAEE